VLTFPDGAKYDGEYKDGQENGRGTYYYPNGLRKSGVWINDKMDGKFVCIGTNGKQWEEFWENGVLKE